MCKVSIITASYNYARFIGEAIRSVQAQSFTDWELIIVDDGSRDNSVEVIKEFVSSDRRIKLFTHESGVNRGLRETLKLAVSKCRGEYIAFLESDDCWKPENLAAKVAVLDKFPEVALVDDEVELFGEASLFSRYDDFWKLRRRIFSRIQFPAAIFTRLFVENLIPTFSCAVCRAEVIKKCSFDYFYAPHLDRSLWLQICKNHKFHHIGEPLSCWRIHGSSYISSEQKAYRKDFLKKVCHLLAPCYKCHRINPAFYLAIFHFTAVNLLRSLRRRFGRLFRI